MSPVDSTGMEAPPIDDDLATVGMHPRDWDLTTIELRRAYRRLEQHGLAVVDAAPPGRRARLSPLGLRRLAGEVSGETARADHAEAENKRLRIALIAMAAGYYDDTLWDRVVEVVGDDASGEPHRLGLTSTYRDMSDEYETHLSEKGRTAIVEALTSGAQSEPTQRQNGDSDER